MNTTEQAMPTETPDIIKKVEQLEATINKQNEIIQKQETLLKSPEFLQNVQGKVKAPEKTPSRNITTMEDFASYLLEQVDAKIQSNNDSFSKNLLPLVRGATPDAEIWSKTDEARKIVEANPGLTMDIAMELAETRLAKKAAEKEKLTQNVRQIEADQRALEASASYRETMSSENPSHRFAASQEDTFNEFWQKHDMDGVIQQMDNDLHDDPFTTGVKPMSTKLIE